MVQHAHAPMSPPSTLASIESLDMTDMRRFLMAPCPRRAGIVQCYITRNRSGTNKLFPGYQVYMKEGDRFLMTSKKRPNNTTSNYLISMEDGDLNRNSAHYLGKLRANFVGTEFQVFDDGVNPRDVEPDDHHGINSVRRELGVVFYAANVLGKLGVMIFRVFLLGLPATLVKIILFANVCQYLWGSSWLLL